MPSKTRKTAMLVVVVAVLGTACTATDNQSTRPQADPAGDSSDESPRFCGQQGTAELVSVDLSNVLDPNGGDYHAEVRIDSLNASGTLGFAGNDEYGLGGKVKADLTAAPVQVEVIVRSTQGKYEDPEHAVEVYRASGMVTPELYQPNGPGCDPELYKAATVATFEGGLEMVPLADAL